MENLSKKNGVKFGIILATYYLLYNIILFLIDPKLFTQPVFGVVNMVVVVLMGILCVYFTKRDFQNLITLKQAFTAYLLMILIGFAANQLSMYVLFNFVKPESIAMNTDILVRMAEENFRAANMSAEEISEKVQLIRASNPYALKTVLFGLAQSIVIGSIAGLLISLIFRNYSEFTEAKQPKS